MRANRAGGIYLHIPFCERKCHYCAFLSGKSTEAEREQYVRALIREIETRTFHLRGKNGEDAHFPSVLMDTVFFGGGTPSLLTPEQIGRILAVLRTHFSITSDAEITMEANPGTLTREKLEGYRAAGVNRLSMGVQSMDDERLRFLGRIHTAADVIREYREARESGFENINLDLIFAVPGMTLADAEEDVRRILDLEPEHVSFYSLQLEEGTDFFRAFEAGRLREVPDEVDRAMYHRGAALFREAGYEHYEISNFAKPGYRSRHNGKYWSMDPYLGFGLGASSYIGFGPELSRLMDGVRAVREINETDLETYTGKAFSGESTVLERTINEPGDDISEAVFTGLRRKEGIDYEEILETEEAFWAYYASEREEAEAFARDGFLEMTKEGLRLTEAGIDISNRIMALFV